MGWSMYADTPDVLIDHGQVWASSDALVQEAGYQNCLHKRLRGGHATIGNALARPATARQRVAMQN